MQVRRRRFFGHVARTYTSLDITRALKVSIRGLPRIGDAHPDVLVIPGYAPWKQISNLLTLASTQHGNTLRIENTGSTSWKPLRSSSGLARDNDDEYFNTLKKILYFILIYSRIKWQPRCNPPTIPNYKVTRRGCYVS